MKGSFLIKAMVAIMSRYYGVFKEIGLNTVKPKGWVYDFLKNQANGLTGNIEVAGYPFDTVGWDRFETDTSSVKGNPGWWAYEQTAYWLDGLTKLAELIDDESLRKKADRSFDFTMNSIDYDGYIGPRFMKESTGWNRWPHVVFFRALMAKYSATEDKSILDAVCRHYKESKHDYRNFRDVMNVEIMLWAYMKTGDKELLDLAEKSFADYNEQCKDDNCIKAQLSNKKAYAHGVTYNEYSKLGAILYICTGKEEYIKPSIKAYRKIDRYHMLPDGLHCSNEFLLDNGYMQSHETCDVTDYTWALGYMLMATGNGEYGDKIEKCIFNAGMGAILEDFKGLQYLSCVNQVILDKTSNHADFLQGDKWMSYRPNPGTECCAGNVNRFFPNYVIRMWLEHENGICAALFGASEITFDGVNIKEETRYPFEDEIRFIFNTEEPKKLGFYIRIPEWCYSPVLKVNGNELTIKKHNGFAVVDRVFNNNDMVTLSLPSKIEVKNWGKDGVYVEKGPLVYTLGIKEKREIDTTEEKSTELFPAYNIYPAEAWNYTILPEMGFEFVTGESKGNPFALETTPFKIKCYGKQVNGWKLKTRYTIHPVFNLYTRPWKRETKKGKFLFTPPYPSKEVIKKTGLGKTEELVLVPYGAAKVRITVFPRIDEN